MPVAHAMGELFTRLGIHGTVQQYNALNAWASVVGEQIARVTTPQRIERGILFVAVASAPWRAELVMRKREIIGKMNQAAGASLIKDIRFR